MFPSCSTVISLLHCAIPSNARINTGGLINPKISLTLIWIGLLSHKSRLVALRTGNRQRRTGFSPIVTFDSYLTSMPSANLISSLRQRFRRLGSRSGAAKITAGAIILPDLVLSQRAVRQAHSASIYESEDLPLKCCMRSPNPRAAEYRPQCVLALLGPMSWHVEGDLLKGLLYRMKIPHNKVKNN